VGVTGGKIEFSISTQMGSVRQTERHAELGNLRREVRGMIESELPPDIRGAVRAGIAVAGTPTSLAAIEQELEPYDPARVHGYVLSHGSCEQMLGELAGLSVAQRRRIKGLHPDRAPTIVAGAVILTESIRSLGLSEVEVSDRDILHGAALTTVR
jgi:exopolyphosphatase / guanosine-5'-triphosphate,3'-diphosphate pyrophosphatase